jgi:hypothetical protein
MGKPNPLNSSGFHRGRRKDTRKGLVSSTSSRRNTCKKRKTVRGCHRRHRRRKHITQKITGGGSGLLNIVVKFNDNEKQNDFKFEIDRIEYPGGSVNWRPDSVALYRELVEKLKGVTGNMGANIPAASYIPGGPSGTSTGVSGISANSGYGSMSNNTNNGYNNGTSINQQKTPLNGISNTGMNTNSVQQLNKTPINNTKINKGPLINEKTKQQKQQKLKELKELNNNKILIMLQKPENAQYLAKFLESAKGGNIIYYNGGGRNDGFKMAMAMVLLDNNDGTMNNNRIDTNVSSIQEILNNFNKETNSNLTVEEINNKSIYKLIFNKNNCEITEESNNKQVKIEENEDTNHIIEIEHIKNNDPSEELKLLLLERLCLEIDSIIDVIKTKMFIKQIDLIKKFIDYINAQIEIYNKNSEKFNHLQKFWKEIKTHFNSESNKYENLAIVLSEENINKNLTVFENFDKNINEITEYYKKNIRNQSLYTKYIPIVKRVENATISFKKFKDNISKNAKQTANIMLPYTVILLNSLTKINDLSDVDIKAKPKYYKTYEKYFTNTSLTDTIKSYGKKVNITDNNENITKIIENINNEKNKISETIDNYNNETLKDKNSWFKYFSKKNFRPIKRVLGDKTAVINKHLDDMNRNMKYLWTIIVHEEKISIFITNYNKTHTNFDDFTGFLDNLKVEIDKLDDKDLIKQEYKK